MIYRLEGTLLIEADDDAEAASILAEINKKIESMDVCGDLQMSQVKTAPPPPASCLGGIAEEWWKARA